MAAEEVPLSPLSPPSPPGPGPAPPPRLSLVAEGLLPEREAQHGPHHQFFRSLRWTGDGTALVATDSANAISTYLLPADLLTKPSPAPRPLIPQARICLPEPCNAFALAPYFSLAEPATQAVLVACRDHPVQLRHLIPALDEREAGSEKEDPTVPRYPTGTLAPVLCTYKIINAQTEKYLTPASILWPSPGTHFICGSASRLDYFDAYRSGTGGPLVTIPTIPSRRHISKGGGVGMRGIVSSLSISPPAQESALGPIVAAGTWTRWLGLYDLNRAPHAVAHWSVAGATEEHFGRDTGGGNGISQTLWSPCGRYLVVNERGGEGLLVYDVRGTGTPVNALAGRRCGRSQMRMDCDIFPGPDGPEVWGGCADGSMVVWQGIGARGGRIEGRRWDASRGAEWADHAPLGGVMLHGGGAVVATCSGGWERDYSGEETGLYGIRRPVGSSRLRVWSLGQPATHAGEDQGEVCQDAA